MTGAFGSDIRGVMIPVTNGRVLLPNATLAEVITYSDPTPVDDAPRWLLGRLSWRGWRLPLFSFAMLSGVAESESYSNAKVTVLKALAGRRRLPYMAMLAQGFPRLTTLNADTVIPTGDGADTPDGVFQYVMVRDDDAIIPDLGAIEQMVAQALQIPDSEDGGQRTEDGSSGQRTEDSRL